MTKYPVIRFLDDILENIDRKKFIVKEAEDYISICYFLNAEEVFPSRLEEPEKYKYAIECRGIKFCSKTKRIIARPFHKFFNLGERKDSSEKEIEKIAYASKTITLTEKLDGSMIHPMKIHDGRILWCTKMGTNAISSMAKNFIDRNPKYVQFANWCFNQGEMGWTPIFEYISPENRIVVEYKEENLVLLAIRDNVTGEYIKY